MDGLTNSKSNRPAELVSRIQKSVIAVLRDSEQYYTLLEDRRLVASISEAVFDNIYKWHRGELVTKKNPPFRDMVSSIMYNTSKVLQVEEAKGQLMRASEYITRKETSPVVFETAQIVVHESLDGEISRDLDFFESQFKDIVSDVIYANSTLTLKTMPPRKDLLYLDCILVVEGTNSNKDTVPAEELQKNYLTLIGMPLVEEHDMTAIKGVFFDSKLVRIKPGTNPNQVKIVEKGGKLAVRARAFIYKKRFPREAHVIKSRFEQGLLRFSTEMAFASCKCSECGEVFGKGDVYCDHLLLRNVINSSTSRIIQDSVFVGGAYTINPAEKAAVAIDVTDGEEVHACVKKGDLGVINNEHTIDPLEDAAASTKTANLDDNVLGDASVVKGDKMPKYSYDSVQELLEAREVNALVEATVDQVLAAERDAFEASIEELKTEIAARKENETALTAKVAELQASLTEASTKLSDLAAEKVVYDAVAEVQNAGHKFGSQDELKAFSDRIRESSPEGRSFIIDLMKNAASIAAASAKPEPVAEPSPAQPTPTDGDGVVNASKNGATHGASDDTEPMLAKARQSWDASMTKVRTLGKEE